MAEITNLNKFRKQKAKSEKEARAQNNRILYGTPKSLKQTTKQQNIIKQKQLDNKKLGDNKRDDE